MNIYRMSRSSTILGHLNGKKISGPGESGDLSDTIPLVDAPARETKIQHLRMGHASWPNERYIGPIRLPWPLECNLRKYQ